MNELINYRRWKFANKESFDLGCAVAFFFLFFLHGFSIGNGQQGILYNGYSFAFRFCPSQNLPKVVLAVVRI